MSQAVGLVEVGAGDFGNTVVDLLEKLLALCLVISIADALELELEVEFVG